MGIEYNPNCYECRKGAGKPPAGVLSLCSGHLTKQAHDNAVKYADLLRRVKAVRGSAAFNEEIGDEYIYCPYFDKLLPEGKEE